MSLSPFVYSKDWRRGRCLLFRRKKRGMFLLLCCCYIVALQWRLRRKLYKYTQCRSFKWVTNVKLSVRVCVNTSPTEWLMVCDRSCCRKKYTEGILFFYSNSCIIPLHVFYIFCAISIDMFITSPGRANKYIKGTLYNALGNIL